jgi:diphthine synthase
MLYLIGLGVYDEGDITLNGVAAAKKCGSVYLERYTSPWQGSVDALSKEIGKSIVTLQRSDMEEKSKKLIDEAEKKDIAILISGDPLVATTHASLITEACNRGIEVRVIHSSSVFSAIAVTGMHIYRFGKTATIAYPEKNFFPTTPYKVLSENLNNDAHTLFLLDVKADKDRYMSVKEAIDLMLEIESKEKKGLFKEDTKCVGVARLGGDTKIAYGTAKELKKQDFGNPPHALIVPSKLHFSEQEYLESL